MPSTLLGMLEAIGDFDVCQAIQVLFKKYKQACKRMCHLIKVSSKMYFFFCHNSNLTTGGGIRAGSKSSSFSSIKYFFSLPDHCNDMFKL